MAARLPAGGAQQQPAVVGAAAAPPGAHPQYSLPALAPEQAYVQKKQAEELQRDVHNMRSLDTATPFADLQDAVMRLLPFHVSCAAQFV